MHAHQRLTSFQGWMAAPKPAVISAPAWKLTSRGLMLMNALAGATMFAATLVVSVAAVRPARRGRGHDSHNVHCRVGHQLRLYLCSNLLSTCRENCGN